MRILRHAIIGLAIGAALALAAFTPTASARSPIPCPEGYRYDATMRCVPGPVIRSAPMSYQGWVQLDLPERHAPCWFEADGSMRCGAPPAPAQHPAWRWTGTAWMRTSISSGQYYAWPYTGAWRWVWSAETGWLAVTAAKFTIV